MQKKTYKAVGIFVIIGFLSLIGIIINYTGKKYLEDEENMVIMYFQESIQGLSVGSSVVLQGVEIGKVSKISLVTNVQEATFQTLVYITFSPKKVYAAKDDKRISNRMMLQHLIEKGLKARLATSSLLTGQLMIELIMDPAQKAVFYGDGKYDEIPTVLSPYEQFSKDFTEIPLRESLNRLSNILAGLDKNLPDILTNVSQITQKLDKTLEQKNGEFTHTVNNLNSTLEEISKASRSIKNLTDYLERHPEAIIQGKEK